MSYEAKKNRLAASLKLGGGSVSLYKKTSNLFRPKKKTGRSLDVRAFNQVIKVDRDRMIAEVEGMTRYETLVDETLKYSCLPTVVPELKSITIGGALSGCGIESSSYRYGLVHETIPEIEVLLGDGSVALANGGNENKELYYAFPNSYGTLGYALKVNVQLIQAKPYVKLEHRRFNDACAFFNEMARLCRERRSGGPHVYIDGVIFAENEMYITTGEFVDTAPQVSNYRYMKIYYQSIRLRRTDYLTTRDYIWRWDPDWFWCSKVFYMQNSLMRLLFGKLMLNSTVYAKIMHFFNRHPRLQAAVTAFEQKKESIIQDVCIPESRAAEFFSFFKNEIGILPVWICPAQSCSAAERFSLCPVKNEILYFDFGFWDSIPTSFEPGHYNRLIEAKVRELKGFKSLYSSSYYTEKEFWDLYDKDLYESLKAKYDPQQRFRDLYSKCTTKQV